MLTFLTFTLLLLLLLFGSNYVKVSVLFDTKVSVFLEKCVVLFSSDSLKMSVFLDNDKKSGKVCGIICQ